MSMASNMAGCCETAGLLGPFWVPHATLVVETSVFLGPTYHSGCFDTSVLSSCVDISGSAS